MFASNGDLSGEMMRWEKWAGSVKVGDRCRVAGVLATVTALTDDYVWARLDNRPDAEPWAWEDCDSVDT